MRKKGQLVGPSSQRGTLPKPPLSKRKREPSNKENFIQITEPLDSAPLTYPSKQFTLSRENLPPHHKSVFKEVTNNRAQCRPGNGQPKSQQLFDRRLSLKCTSGSYSQQLQLQKSHRMSMVPLRRESLGMTVSPPSLLDERQTTSSLYQQSLQSEGRPKSSIRRQIILTNLMHKLDHEEDLRSIIESKLRNVSSTTLSTQPRQRRNQSYMTENLEESQNMALASKLRHCENEITFFKAVITDMSDKIGELMRQRHQDSRDEVAFRDQRVSMNNERPLRTDERARRINNEVMSVLEGGRGCQSVGVQAEGGTDSSCFMANLERTLRVLDGQH